MAGAAFAQPAPQPRDVPLREPARALLSAGDLDTLVAPIALYPDPLLSQVLAASTYPLELVVAQQWLEQHQNLQGAQLIDAAKQMNWDASVQAMVAFPEVLRKLTQNVSWTTDVGNAFLSQQGDVLDAIQRLRARARDNGRLESTPEQTVTAEVGPDRNVLAIRPANPQTLYVPVYSPYQVWGPPAEGEYPRLWYPSSGLGFGSATAIGGLFSGLLSWSGWGWGMSWLTHGLVQNGLFLNQFGLGSSGGGYGGGAYNDTSAWVHNPAHRLGVPYVTSAVARRFGGSSPGNGFASRRNPTPASSSRGGWQNFGGRPVSAGDWRTFGAATGGGPYRRPYPGTNGAMNYRQESRVPYQPAASYRGYSASPGSSTRMPQAHASAAPRQHARSYSESNRPGGGGHFSLPKSHSFKAPKYSAPKSPSHSHSSKGHSGGHSKGHRH